MHLENHARLHNLQLRKRDMVTSERIVLEHSVLRAWSFASLRADLWMTSVFVRRLTGESLEEATRVVSDYASEFLPYHLRMVSLGPAYDVAGRLGQYRFEKRTQGAYVDERFPAATEWNVSGEAGRARFVRLTEVLPATLEHALNEMRVTDSVGFWGEPVTRDRLTQLAAGVGPGRSLYRGPFYVAALSQVTRERALVSAFGRFDDREVGLDIHYMSELPRSLDDLAHSYSPASLTVRNDAAETRFVQTSEMKRPNGAADA